MAKKSAHGIVLFQASKTVANTEPDALITSDKVTYAYFSDGVVLQKTDVVFAPSKFEPNGWKYSYGWKICKRTGRTGEPLYQALRKTAAIYAEKGWKVEVNRVPVERVA